MTKNNSQKTAKAVIQAQASKEYKQSSIYLMKRIVRYFKPYRWHIFFSFIALGGVSLTTAGTAYLVEPAMREIFDQKNADALFFVPLFFVLITLLKGVCRYIQNCLMQYSGLNVLERMRKELYDKLIYLPLSYYEETKVGLIMSHITNDIAMIRTALPQFLMLVRNALTMFALLFVVFYRDFNLAVYSVVVLPICILPLIYFGKKLRKYGRNSQAKIADISVFLQEILSGIRVVKAFATEKHETGRFNNENKQLLRLGMKQTYVSELSAPTMELIGAIGIAMVLFFGGREVIYGRLEMGAFFSFCTALVLLYEPMKNMNRSNVQIQQALAAAERVFGLLDNPYITPEASGTQPFKNDFKTLEFRNVSFDYNDGKQALSSITITINRGERLALVGPSGAGKTTFASLIPLFYKPTEGQILLDDSPLEDFSLQSLRSNIAVVSQDTFLFNLSVTENIAYGLKNISSELVEQAAHNAFAHDFIMELPQQYDTELGERGIKLSGGQKQRITIARAILKNAPILILDEATSALDSQAEQIVQHALENLMENRTSIVIAHRLSTILNADRIVVMRAGSIVDTGTHQELIQRCALYQELYSAQFSDKA